MSRTTRDSLDAVGDFICVSYLCECLHRGQLFENLVLIRFNKAVKSNRSEILVDLGRISSRRTSVVYRVSIHADQVLIGRVE